MAALDYDPTRYELEVVAHEWALVRLRSEWDGFWSSQTECHVRETEFATQRIRLIRELIGNERCQATVRCAEEKFRREQDPIQWEAFKRVTERLQT